MADNDIRKRLYSGGPSQSAGYSTTSKDPNNTLGAMWNAVWDDKEEEPEKQPETMPTSAPGEPVAPATSPTPEKPTKTPEQILDVTLDKNVTKFPELTKFDRSTLNKKRDDIRSLYEKYQDNLETREMTEKMTQAITKLLAGYYGLKHGQDLSGVKFDKTDWGKKMDQAIRKLDNDLAAVSQEEGRLEKEHYAQFSTKEKQADVNEADRLQRNRQTLQKYTTDKRAEAYVEAAKGKQVQEQQKATTDATKSHNNQVQQAQRNVLTALTQDLKKGDEIDAEKAARIIKMQTGTTKSVEDIEKSIQEDVPGSIWDSKRVNEGFIKRKVKEYMDQDMGIESGAPTQDPDAVKYADMYNIPYDQAKTIIDKRRAVK